MKRYHIFLIVFTVIFTVVVIVISNQRSNHLKNMVANINKNQVFIFGEQGKIIQSLNEELERKQKVTISFYHPQSKGINSDSNPNRTATMTRPTVGKTIAISQELFDLGWLGNRIYINGFGIFHAEDRMGCSVKGKQIDICVASKKQALRLGVKYNVIAVRLNI